MTTTYDVSKIAELSEVEKVRIIAAYLNHNEPKNVDWAAAASQAGSKSKESYKKMFDTTLKKLVASPGENDKASSAPAPAAAPKKGGRKRAAPADGEKEEPPKAKKTRKPRGRKAKSSEPGADDATSGAKMKPEAEAEV